MSQAGYTYNNASIEKYFNISQNECINLCDLVQGKRFIKGGKIYICQL